MEIEKTPIAGLLVIHPKVFDDDRGFFYESFNEVAMRESGIDIHWAQDNHASSRKDTLRGLHFQLGEGQAKLVRCIAGEVWDVAVDIRRESPTFRQWFGVTLSAENRKMFLVPAGFAHGYVVLSEESEVLYKCSKVYDAKLESEFRWNDPTIGVEWPVENPVISKRDAMSQSFDEYLEKLESTAG